MCSVPIPHITRILRALLSLLVGSIIITACGGGGEELGPTPPSTVLSYVLSGPRAGVTPLAVSGTATGGAVTAAFTSPAAPLQELPNLPGTYDTATLDYMLNSSFNPAMWLDTSGTGAPFGTLEVTINQPFHWNNGTEPSSGTLSITSRDIIKLFTGTIRLTVTSVPSAGVNISLDSNNDGTPDEFRFVTWADFDMLWDDATALLWQRIASFTYSMHSFLFAQADLAIQSFTTIEDLYSGFETAGPGSAQTVTCSSTPPDPSWANNIKVTWNDLDNSTTITNGDSFSFFFDDCWIDNPTDNIDQVLTGTMNFLHYDRHVQACPTYDNLIITETDAGGAIANTDITVSGGFCLLIPGI